MWNYLLTTNDPESILILLAQNSSFKISGRIWQLPEICNDQ
jgi:hypothetical protein